MSPDGRPAAPAAPPFGTALTVLLLVMILVTGSAIAMLDRSGDPPLPPAPGVIAGIASPPGPDPTLVAERPVATPIRDVPTRAPEPTATPAQAPTSAPVLLPANELGRVPIFMYHAFVHNEENTDEWTLTYDQFRWQLDWLRTHDFVMVSLDSVLTGRIDLPAGKRPVVLTFDDSPASQFGLQPSAAGGFEVRPDTVVGILEAYGAQYPEFAGPAFFAVLPHNCFASADDPSTCEQRLRWLSDHGYEIGNHTFTHQELTDVSDELLTREIGEAQRWIDARVTGPTNLSHVLVLPFGSLPEAAHQRAWLAEGIPHEVAQVRLSLVLGVSGGPAPVRYSTRWESVMRRCQTTPSSFQHWADAITTEEVLIYVSDGDPNALTIPAGWEEYVHIGRLTESGVGLRVLDPDAPS